MKFSKKTSISKKNSISKKTSWFKFNKKLKEESSPFENLSQDLQNFDELQNIFNVEEKESNLEHNNDSTGNIEKTSSLQDQQGETKVLIQENREIDDSIVSENFPTTNQPKVKNKLSLKSLFSFVDFFKKEKIDPREVEKAVKEFTTPYKGDNYLNTNKSTWTVKTTNHTQGNLTIREVLHITSFNYKDKDELLGALNNNPHLGIENTFVQRLNNGQYKYDLYSALDFYRFLKENSSIVYKFTNGLNDSNNNIIELEQRINKQYHWILFELNDYVLNKEFESNINKYKQLVTTYGDQVNERFFGQDVKYVPNKLNWKTRFWMLLFPFLGVTFSLIYVFGSLNGTLVKSSLNTNNYELEFPLNELNWSADVPTVTSISSHINEDGTVDKSKLDVYMSNTYHIRGSNPYDLRSVLTKEVWDVTRLVRSDALENRSIVGFKNDDLNEYLYRLNYKPFKNVNLVNPSFEISNKLGVDNTYQWKLDLSEQKLELMEIYNKVGSHQNVDGKNIDNKVIILEIPVVIRSRDGGGLKSEDSKEVTQNQESNNSNESQSEDSKDSTTPQEHSNSEQSKDSTVTQESGNTQDNSQSVTTPDSTVSTPSQTS